MAEAKLGRCPRCKGYALVDSSTGIRTAVDIAPVDPVGLGNALARGLRLWWVENATGRPSRILRPHSPGQRPPWGPTGAQEGAQRLHASHGCGAPYRDIVIMNVQSPKGSAPATPGAPGAGNHPHAALDVAVAGLESPSPATYATRRPSDCAVRCHDCRKLIEQKSQEFVGIFYERWIWAVHVDCP